jgi:hypothetical protein
MTNTVKTIVQNLIRLAVLWLVDALSLAGAAWILPGLVFTAVGVTPRWIVIVSAALLLAIINFLIRPIVLLLARPLGWVALLVSVFWLMPSPSGLQPGYYPVSRPAFGPEFWVVSSLLYLTPSSPAFWKSTMKAPGTKTAFNGWPGDNHLTAPLSRGAG